MPAHSSCCWCATRRCVRHIRMMPSSQHYRESADKNPVNFRFIKKGKGKKGCIRVPAFFSRDSARVPRNCVSVFTERVLRAMRVTPSHALAHTPRVRKEMHVTHAACMHAVYCMPGPNMKVNPIKELSKRSGRILEKIGAESPTVFFFNFELRDAHKK